MADLYIKDVYLGNYNPILVENEDGSFRPLTLEDIRPSAKDDE